MAYPLGQKNSLAAARLRKSDPPDNNVNAFSFLNEPPPPARTRQQLQGSQDLNELNDTRSSLHRRFTTNTFISPIGQQRRQAAEAPVPEIPSVFQSRIPPSEKKKAEYEYLRQRQLYRQNQLDKLNVENRRGELELQRLSQELGFKGALGHQSEPTTPPELKSSGFPTALSKPNRFSASNLASAPGSSWNLPAESSGIASPPTERERAYNALTAGSSTASMSQSTHHSDPHSDEEQQAEEVLDFNPRSAAALNRNSMPVTRRDMGSSQEAPAGHNEYTRYLFENESSNPEAPNTVATQRPKSYLHISQTDDEFPVLLRRPENQMPTAVATSQDEKDSPPHINPRSMLHRSMPPQTGTVPFGFNGESGSNNQSNNPSGTVTPSHGNTSHGNNRHSLGARIGLLAKDTHLTGPPTRTAARESREAAPKLLASKSTNAIPTVHRMGNNNQHEYSQSGNFDYHSMTGYDSLSHDENDEQSPVKSGHDSTHHSLESIFSAGRNAYAESSATEHSPTGSNFSPYGGVGVQSPYHGMPNNMQMLNSAMSNISLNTPPNWNGGASIYANVPSFQPVGQYRYRDAQAPQAPSVTMTRAPRSFNFQTFQGPLESLTGEIYSLCKDQHGCRFLQKKLDEDVPSQTSLIFDETKGQMTELMTDPFGNYLCQKLLERVTPAQRTELINNAAPSMVKIALNQHGTRALQKMIDFIATREQIDSLIQALKDHVVQMIQDLNGNHVIQKCLNRLSQEDHQFVVEAVSDNCVAVGTHRHGCCVIQRCIDHATPSQKVQLITAITEAAIPLVQDPFGNYVLQYIFDQNEESFNHLLIYQLQGYLVMLSTQKFSSNVVEKCIRVAKPDVKHELIEELMASPDFGKMVDDQFANYVLQTAWDHAAPEDGDRLVDKILPELPRIRSKPHGRRFQARLADREARMRDDNSSTPRNSFTNGGGAHYSYNGDGLPPPPVGSGMAPGNMSYPPPNHEMSGMQSPTGDYNGYGHNGFSSDGFGTNGYTSPTHYQPFSSPEYSRPISQRVGNQSFPNFSYLQTGMPNAFTPFGRGGGYY